MNRNKILNMSVPTQYVNSENFQDDRFRKIRILVMHDGLNLNGSIFSKESMELAKESLKNIPILAYVKKKDGEEGCDFAGHESEIIIGEDGIKYRYLGRPIGMIPSENNYHYEIYDDKTYVCVDGYIWTDYANEALDILERDSSKGHSMEIRIDDAEWDSNDYLNITKYRYTGLTLLGDGVNPAMVGSKAELFSLDKDKNTDYFTMVEELNKALKEFQEALESNDEGSEGSDEGGSSKNDEGLDSGTPEGEEGFEADNNNNDNPNPSENDESDLESFKLKIENQDTIIAELTDKFNELETKYNALLNENKELLEFKTNIENQKELEQKNNIIEEFKSLLDKSEIDEIIEDIDKYTVDSLYAKLSILYTQKTLKSIDFSKKENKESMYIDITKKSNGSSRYYV